ncbi:CMGC/SRPK protein kinase [Spizellomyces punctatus DAOM BR117]|uniref:non-specific serine/threonine protein kinase n=1 Tax=Spizellomyces punctatus (strain DAOM BR117) TaxID=645134 RepID=A0A0L0HJC2_SPIPD|nr:CMGC/SRPK protein kinase [Spizellomyces punctatus DAOM BR117]KND00995.1 CMGC/SRPK protein kinase [Spizellomyces punctatus DAOM BR117]|eukprot:XP_016609034.1 CMGC/SRPK protein kinase [Spizellomyces punctatus DAOM BR117]
MSSLAAMKKTKSIASVVAAKKRRRKPAAGASNASGKTSSSSTTALKKVESKSRVPPEELNSSDESEFSEEEEDAEDYCKGGYHPVNIGDVFNEGRYTVLRKLGWGHFSTVWLARDHKFNRPVALKIVKSAPHYTETALDEIKLLDKVVSANRDNPERRCVVELYDWFKHRGPHGTHVCMAFEVLGPNLLTLIRQYHHRGIPVPIVQRITKQVLMGLDYLHRECAIIHTDLKPENVLICINVDETMKKLGVDVSNTPSSMDLDSPTPSPREGTPMSPASTPTLTRAQRKKAKYKLKKQQAKKQTQGGFETGATDEAGDVVQKEGTDAESVAMKSDSQNTAPPSSIANGKLADAVNQEGSLRERSTDALGRNLSDISLAESYEAKAAAKDLKEREGEGEFNHKVQAEARMQEEGPKKHAQDEDSDADRKRRREERRERRRKQDERIKVKIADLGNACWVDHHFTNDIQTRQYRSPEAILGANYDRSADIWSVGCMVFELLTGDYLFDPQAGSRYTKDDDHVAQIIELLGDFPKSLALSGKATAAQMLNSPWVATVNVDEDDEPPHVHRGFPVRESAEPGYTSADEEEQGDGGDAKSEEGVDSMDEENNGEQESEDYEPDSDENAEENDQEGPEDRMEQDDTEKGA